MTDQPPPYTRSMACPHCGRLAHVTKNAPPYSTQCNGCNQYFYVVPGKNVGETVPPLPDEAETFGVYVWTPAGRILAERIAVPPPIERPKRMIELSFKTGADDLAGLVSEVQDLLYTLRALHADELPYKGYGGGAGSHYNLEIEINPAQDHDTYFKQLEAYLAAVKGSGAVSVLQGDREARNNAHLKNGYLPADHEVHSDPERHRKAGDKPKK